MKNNGPEKISICKYKNNGELIKVIEHRFNSFNEIEKEVIELNNKLNSGNEYIAFTDGHIYQ